MDEPNTFLPVKLRSPDDGYPPTGLPVTEGDIFETVLLLRPNHADAGHPEYDFLPANGGCHKRKGDKHFFGHASGYRVDYRIVFRIQNAGLWSFDYLEGPIKFTDKSVLDFYAVSDKQDDRFTLSVHCNQDEVNHLHTFNLFVLDKSTNPPTPGKVDPDVDNPPLGFP